MTDGTSDPDLGKIGPGHVCKHGVRFPHTCTECDNAAWAARQSFDEDHAVRRSRGGRGSVQRSHRAEGRNWVD